MPSSSKSTSPDRGKRVLAFLSDSTADYLAARTLLLANLPQQGAVLASTSLEKACKAMLAFHGNESHGHLKRAHWNAVRAFDRRLFASLNADFLVLSQKAYRLRYTDELPAGFNLVIATREFLAELDATILPMHQRFWLDGQPSRKTKLQSLLEGGDKRLVIQNHVVDRFDKQEFIKAAPQLVYEVRARSARGLLEMSYWAKGPATDPSFLRQGCEVVDAEKDIYKGSHLQVWAG